jgi:branched-chain amino acid transport system ATP-binding protein
MAWFEIENLEASYHSGIPVLHGVDIGMEEGGFVSVIGSNGAGKSSLLRAISRIISTKGKIIFNGENLARMNPPDVIRRGIIHCPEGRLLFPNMSVNKNLMMGAYLRTDKNEIEKDLEKVYEFLPVLKDRAKQLAGTLSGGEQQMLAVGRAVMGGPKLILMDEPSFGLAPLIIDAIFDVIQKLNEEGLSILVVEQNAAIALERTSYTYVLEEGHVVKEGPSRQIAADPDIAKAYLGVD